jgi:hypothetical protein
MNNLYPPDPFRRPVVVDLTHGGARRVQIAGRTWRPVADRSLGAPRQDCAGTQALVQSSQNLVHWLRTPAVGDFQKGTLLSGTAIGTALLFAPKAFFWPLLAVGVAAGLVSATK